MKVLDLAKELNVTSKDIISYLRENDYKVSSHMQNVTDDMIDLAREHFESSVEIKPNESIKKLEETSAFEQPKSTKVFKEDERILCKSLTPWSLTAVGVDKNTVYHWNNFGDIDYVKFRDLQALRRTEYITKPQIMIMDDDLRSQWSRELSGLYKYYEGIDYPEEYFDLPDEEFNNLLKNAPDTVKDIIKTTAVSMIRHENYPSINKIKTIDDLLGTCIKEFI